MFLHIFKQRTKIMLREREGLFWTLLFPIILAFFFHVAFANLLSGEKFEPIDIAVVNSAQNSSLVTELKDSDMFKVKETDENEAKELLSDNKITGFITMSDEPVITISGNGVNQTILKTFMDKHTQISSTIVNIMTENPANAATFTENTQFYYEFTKSKPISNNNDYTVIYFYALIAMACLNGSGRGVAEISMLQANQSSSAARASAAPVNKITILLAAAASEILFQFVSIVLVLAFLQFVLKVNFGAQIPAILILCFVSSIASIFLGMMVGALLKKSEEFKGGLLIAITMFGNFLAGLMVVQMKYIVQTKAPFISYINISNLIADGLYSLYFYGVGQRFYVNVIILSAMSVVFAAITLFAIRRQKYASI